MFARLFPSRKPQPPTGRDSLYAAIVAAARQPRLYADWGAPDTPLGRVEMICLHMILVQRRLIDQGDAARHMAQSLMDEYFMEVEHSLRELGISDVGVPKRMKKLGQMHFGRIASYGEALDKADAEALAAALKRNVRPDAADWKGADALATYALEAEASLKQQPLADLLAGRARFPGP